MKGLSLKSAKEKGVVNKNDEGRAFGLLLPRERFHAKAARRLPSGMLAERQLGLASALPTR
ncbi:hypothetical protein GCM10027288_33460 [Bordetella tumbae]